MLTSATWIGHQRAILRALKNPQLDSANGTDSADDEGSLGSAQRTLSELINGTVARREGNSCLVLGPKGSGKSTLVENTLVSFARKAYIVRLSGHAQLSDRAAIREMSRQLELQSGKTFDFEGDDAEDDEGEDDPTDHATAALPPAAHILSLISRLPSLPLPTVVVIDGLDLFAAHPRQALLYCLFDAAQSCRADKNTGRGIAIIAQTSRVDAVNLLEKRVKSRFSHRVITVSAALPFEDYVAAVRARLCPSDSVNQAEQAQWERQLDTLLADQKVKDELNKVYSISPDMRLMARVLTAWVLRPQDSSPFLHITSLQAAVNAQCGPPRFPFLPTLPYPALGLLIAASHERSAGHDVVTFEMLHDRFESQIRSSSAAPVQLGGMSIGMLKCPRSVVFAAFEHLVSVKVFQPAGPTAGITRQFWKYRCVPDRHDIRIAIDQTGQMNLRRWFYKDGK